MRRCVGTDLAGIDNRDQCAVSCIAPHAAGVVENRDFAISVRTDSNRYQAGQADIQVVSRSHRHTERGAARFNDAKRRKSDPRVTFVVECTNRLIPHKPTGRVVAVETKLNNSSVIGDGVDSRCVFQFIKTRLKYNGGGSEAKPRNEQDHGNADKTHLKKDHNGKKKPFSKMTINLFSILLISFPLVCSADHHQIHLCLT